MCPGERWVKAKRPGWPQGSHRHLHGTVVPTNPWSVAAQQVSWITKGLQNMCCLELDFCVLGAGTELE